MCRMLFGNNNENIKINVQFNKVKELLVWTKLRQIAYIHAIIKCNKLNENGIDFF